MVDRPIDTNNRLILSNKTVTSIICDCCIREYYKLVFSEFDPEKSDQSDMDMWIDMNWFSSVCYYFCCIDITN